MSDRSLIATPGGIRVAKIELKGMRLNQGTLASRLGVTRQPINKFFRGKSVSNDIFIKICNTLKLDWQVIAGIKPQGLEVKGLLEIVPMDILHRIEPNTSLELVRDILSSPHKIYKSIVPVFSKTEIRTNVWHYSFANADIEIESDDEESVKIITLQSHDIKPHNIFKLPFSESVGVLTIHDVLQECGAEKVEHFTSMRDAFIAIECYKGRLGGYLVFTFGCYNHPDLLASTYVDRMLRNYAGKEVDISKLLINFVSITHEENRGHPIPQGF
jgi:transcriptional regulator with XRE-family HTH domain